MTKSTTKAPRSGRRKTEVRLPAPSPLPYGRESDIGIIDGLMDRVRECGAALVISGEPGIGKSALLDFVQYRDRNRGIRALRSLIDTLKRVGWSGVPAQRTKALIRDRHDF